MELGSDRFTNTLDFLHKQSLNQDKRMDGMMKHFDSKMKEFFRRVSILEDRRRAFPTTAEEPLCPLPAPSLTAELDSLQTRLYALEKQADLEPIVKRQGQRLNSLSESLENTKRSAANFKIDANKKLDRYRVYEQQIDRLNTLTARYMREPEANVARIQNPQSQVGGLKDAGIQNLKSQIGSLKAGNKALKGTVGLLVKFAKGEINAAQVRILAYTPVHD
jgi:hypothetical protein